MKGGEVSKRRRARKNPSINPHLARMYTDLHEGRPPDKVIMHRLPKPPKYLIELGTVPEFTYSKKTPEANPHLYRHEFAEWAQPVLARDDQGKLHILDQENLTVTERGIEDMARKHKFGSRRGHHFGSRRHHGRRHAARHNPLNMDTLKKVGLSAGVVGGLASATMIGMDMLFSKVPQLQAVTGYKKAGVQAGVGVALSVLFQSFGLETIAAGVGVGGVTAGINSAYGTMQSHPALAASSAPAASTPAASTPAASTPASLPAPATAPASGLYPSVAAPMYAAR